MSELEPILRHVIWSSLTKKCKPLPSLPITYNEDKGFRINISSSELISLLNKSNIVYKAQKQILNFNSKVTIYFYRTRGYVAKLFRYG